MRETPATHPPTPATDTVALDREIELKLRCAPGDLERLRSDPAIAGRASTRGTIRHLESRYFDTPDLTLHRTGLSLRVRKTGKRFMQTLKSGVSRGTVLARGEWETPVDTFTPDLGAIAGQVADTLLGDGALSELQPLFATRVRRHALILRETDPASLVATEIEAAFDIGAVETPQGSEPIAKIELQLRKGSAEALYRIALELEERAALQVETRSKSARGYAMVTGAPARWHKAGPSELAADARVDDAFAFLTKDCLRHWQINERAALEGIEAEGVHRVRVALRRLTSLLALFKSALHPDHRAVMTTDVKRLLKSFQATRDWDVFLSDILRPVIDSHPGDAGLSWLKAQAIAEREAAYAAMRETVAARDYARTFLRLGLWAESRGWRAAAEAGQQAVLNGAVEPFARKVLAKRWKKVSRLAKDLAGGDDQAVHRMRLALKKLRYGTHFFRSLFPGRKMAAYLEAVSGLQDRLGHFNDVAASRALIGRLLARPDGDGPAIRQAAGLAIGWHSHAAHAARKTLLKSWHALERVRPF